MAWVGLKVWWDLRGLSGQGSVSEVDGDSDIVLPASFVRGGFSKGTMISASTSVWEKATSPALTLNLYNSVPPHMSLLHLLSCCPNTGAHIE